MTTPNWSALFETQCGIPLDVALAPITQDCPEGDDLRAEAVYRQIKHARYSEDPSLPQGPWERTLKRADWNEVKEMTLQALVTRSKDLQLCFWLFEAQLHLCGFAAIAPQVQLIHCLCERYWDRLYPTITDDGLEHRRNVFLAANKALVPTLRLIPLVQNSEVMLSWAECLRAQRNHQLLAGGFKEQDVDGPSISDCRKVLLSMPDEDLITTTRETGDARCSLALLRELLDTICQTSPPSLGAIDSVLEEIHTFLVAELGQRGYEVITAYENASDAASEADHSGDDGAREPHVQRQTASSTDAIASVADVGRQRALAYDRLGEIAELLQRLDPHSPSPYLILRAVAWGKLSTAQLYQELFVRSQGQLSIFELMGIQPQK